jgi:hypothetical protein
VRLTLQPGIPHRLRRGWRATRTPARVTGTGLALGWRLAILRHGAGALHPIQFRPAAAATSRPGRAGPLSRSGITKSQQRACTDASRFHSDPILAVLGTVTRSPLVDADRTLAAR